MGNCLVKQLKGSVSNSNLEKLGELKFFSVDGSNLSSSDYTVEGTGVVASVDGDCLSITNKYNITRLTLRSSIKARIEQLQYCQMTFLNLQASCDTSKLYLLPNTIEDFRRNLVVEAYYDISLFSHLISLTKLVIDGLSGTFESFIEGQISKGRNSCNINITSGYNTITFNGETYPANNLQFALQQGSTEVYDITIKRKSVEQYATATYNKITGTWTYPNS